MSASPKPPSTRSEVTRHRDPQRAILRNKPIFPTGLKRSFCETKPFFDPLIPMNTWGYQTTHAWCRGAGKERGGLGGAPAVVLASRNRGLFISSTARHPRSRTGAAGAGNSELGMRPRQEREATGGRETKPRGQVNQAGKKKAPQGSLFSLVWCRGEDLNLHGLSPTNT